MRPLAWLLPVVLCAAAPASAGKKAPACAPDAVAVGTLCVDRFEASVWNVPEPTRENAALVAAIQDGTATAEALEQAGATQLGCGAPFPTRFPPDGSWTKLAGLSSPTPGVYAVSLPGVVPTACITWPQALQACFLSGKRLPTNAEWQRAAVGTPDPNPPGADDCNVASAGADPTGAHGACVSRWGASDMAGNLWEMTGTWADRNPSACTSWLHDDFSCFGGPGGTGGADVLGVPGIVFRGGAFTDGELAGPYALKSDIDPLFQNDTIGFRCVR